MKKIKLPEIDAGIVIEEISTFIIDQITASDRTGGVIGLSGGVDSSTTSALAKRAFDIYNAHLFKKNNLELVGYILPSNTNNPDDEKDAIELAEKLGIIYEILEIDRIVDAFKETNPQTFRSNYNKGNLMSEVRAVILHAKAASENKLVIGTGNHDEDFGIGYYTLYGDGAVHISPIGNLSKRNVRKLAHKLSLGHIADRVPTAGLEFGQTDFKDLGYGYNLVEIVYEGFKQGFSLEELALHPQIVPLAERQLQVYESEFGNKKFSDVDQLIKDIYWRNRIAKAKAEILHPPAAKITARYE
ncbi:MAG: NAD(+) synthase [archaeon]